MRYTMPFVAGFVILGSCGVNEENFGEKMGTSVCSWYETCMEDGQFEEYFGGLDACESSLESYMSEAGEGCTFNKSAAKACLNAIKTASGSCDQDIEGDDCENVWECTEG